MDANTGNDANGGYSPGEAKKTIQAGVSQVSPSGSVIVAAGTYDEDVVICDPGRQLLGAGSGSTNVRGPIGGPRTTIQVAASNVTIARFTITRLGNNTTDWNNPGLNSAGIAVQGQAITGMLVHDNILTGNRTGIDVNNSNGHTIRNNVIDFNRTGMIFRNQTDNRRSWRTSSRTTGPSAFSSWMAAAELNPCPSALHSGFNNNNLSGNWYGQIVDRQSGGSLPAPGTTNLKNFRGDWFGTTSPVITTSNSAEPGYAAQIPWPMAARLLLREDSLTLPDLLRLTSRSTRFSSAAPTRTWQRRRSRDLWIPGSAKHDRGDRGRSKGLGFL